MLEVELTFQVMFDGVPGREDTTMGRKAEPVNGDTGFLLKADDTEASWSVPLALSRGLSDEY